MTLCPTTLIRGFCVLEKNCWKTCFFNQNKAVSDGSDTLNLWGAALLCYKNCRLLTRFFDRHVKKILMGSSLVQKKPLPCKKNHNSFGKKYRFKTRAITGRIWCGRWRGVAALIVGGGRNMKHSSWTNHHPHWTYSVRIKIGSKGCRTVAAGQPQGGHKGYTGVYPRSGKKYPKWKNRKLIFYSVFKNISFWK